LGDVEEDTTLWDKVKNDTGWEPTRHFVDPGSMAQEPAAYRKLDGLPIKKDRDAPLLYISENAIAGYRFIVGTYDFEETLHGVILLDPAGNVLRSWQISQETDAWEHENDTNVFPHGFDVLSDGSFVIAFDQGSSLIRYDFCGEKRWQIQGRYHHSVDLYNEDAFWVWFTPDRRSGDYKGSTGDYLTMVSTADGSLLRRFHMGDIIAANPDIDILAIRQDDTKVSSTWIGDPFHENDIDPLPDHWSSAYPLFEAGDLLVSLRSLNLVFVLDPDMLDVKWWRFGLFRRQHDPDWNSGGTITVYNNNMHRGASSIVEIDPVTFESSIIVDGNDYDFYSVVRGKHQSIAEGHMLITSSQQGRVFEVGPKGDVNFDFHNIYDTERGLALPVSEALFIPEGFFQEIPTCNNETIDSRVSPKTK
jgi:hypothetical protein